MNSARKLLALALLAPLGGAEHGEARAAEEPQAHAAAGVSAAAVWTAEERAAIELLRSLRAKERPSDAELAARLAPGGARLLPLLFAVLAERSVPATEPGAGEAQILSEVQERVIQLALGQLERNAVLAHVASELRPEPTVKQRLAALGCIGAVGQANDLLALLELALAPRETELDARLEQGLRRAVASILARDGRAFEQLVVQRRVTRSELLPALVAAVGDARDGRGLTYLSEVAYWHENLVLDVMSQVRLVGPSSEESVNEVVRTRLRPYLDESRPGPCRAAILALTTLRDLDSIGPLVALLASEEGGLAENAHWALRALTGLDFSASRETWARWHQAELAWMLREKPREFQRLRADEAGRAAAALREILTHPLARAELATALPELLHNRWPAVRVLACATLADLGAESCVPQLVWALEDRDPDVAKAAHAALRRLTGQDLPRDPTVWQVATNTEPRGTEL